MKAHFNFYYCRLGVCQFIANDLKAHFNFYYCRSDQVFGDMSNLKAHFNFYYCRYVIVNEDLGIWKHILISTIVDFDKDASCRVFESTF